MKRGSPQELENEMRRAVDEKGAVTICTMNEYREQVLSVSRRIGRMKRIVEELLDSDSISYLRMTFYYDEEKMNEIPIVYFPLTAQYNWDRIKLFIE